MTPQIIAHRGASYLAPENTLTAFKKAMEIGADGVEMDVQQTIDAGLVIHHDYIIDLHTDISGRIYDMTEGELKDLDFGSWKDVAYKDEKIATLAEALALCRSMEGCAVQLEMKSTMDNDPAFVSGVVDAIRAADIADRLVLISFNHDLLRQAKALMPELRVGVLLYGAFESMVLPPPVIWKDLGLVNGMEDEEAALDEELAGTDDFLLEETVKKEQARQLREAVALLSEVDREIIRRFYDLCQTAPEIAAVLGLTPSAVRMRLVRSREAIKNELCRGGFVYE